MADWTRPSEKVLKRNLLLFGFNEGKIKEKKKEKKKKKVHQLAKRG